LFGAEPKLLENVLVFKKGDWSVLLILNFYTYEEIPNPCEVPSLLLFEFAIDCCELFKDCCEFLMDIDDYLTCCC